MNKKEAMDFIRKYKGYVPYIGIFEIYDNNDEIPQELIDLEIKKDEPNGNFMIVSKGLHDQFKDMNL